MPQAAQRRFLAKVNRTGECWLWTASVTTSGYGQFRYRLPDGTYRIARAHRLMMEMVLGTPIPDGVHVLHSCDTPRCVRPAHLRLGSHSDNMCDAVERGRHRHQTFHGELHPRARLTATQVEELRVLRGQGWLLRDLAARYSIGLSQVSRVARAVAWPVLEEAAA